MLTAGNLSKFGLVVCTLSLVFQLLGFTCPGWLVLNTDLSVLSLNPALSVVGFGEVATETALWFVRVCVYGDASSSCSLTTEHNHWDMGLYLNTALADLREIDWIKAQILLSLALLFCLVTLAAVVVNFCDIMHISDKVFYLFIAANSFLSGILVFPPVIEVGLATENTKAAIKTVSVASGHEFISIGSPFALVFSSAGLVLAVLASLLFVLAALKVKSEKLTATIFPTTFLSPAILKIGNFPANISMSDRIGHAPPTYNKTGEGLPPPIGSKDDEPLTFENKGLIEQAIEPFVLFSLQGKRESFLYPPDDTEPDTTPPLPFENDNSSSPVNRKKLAGSLSLSNGGTGSPSLSYGGEKKADDTSDVFVTDRSPRPPRNKTVKLRKISENDIDTSGNKDTLGKEFAHMNNSNVGLSPRRDNGSPGRSPTSPKKTVKINQVSTDQIQAINTGGQNNKAQQTVKKAGQKVTKATTEHSTDSHKPCKPSTEKKSPQVTKKKVSITTVKVEDLMMK